MIYILTPVLAFCSVVYELLLGQTLSAFFGNTVLRYSVTIGLYMFSMGIGALLVRGRVAKSPVISLQLVELLLAIIGGYSLALLFFLDWVGVPLLVFSVISHGLIIVIGILTGAEIPLLIALQNKKSPRSETSVLGIDYVGAFLGTLVFAFYFYPTMGLTFTALTVALLNAVAGLFLVAEEHNVEPERQRVFSGLLVGQGIICLCIGYSLYRAHTLNEYFVSLYLN